MCRPHAILWGNFIQSLSNHQIIQPAWSLLKLDSGTCNRAFDGAGSFVHGRPDASEVAEFNARMFTRPHPVLKFTLKVSRCLVNLNKMGNLAYADKIGCCAVYKPSRCHRDRKWREITERQPRTGPVSLHQV